MTSEKLQALEQLIQKQLSAGHIEEYTSPWNSPVFVIKKKSRKWRKGTNLGAISKAIQVMGSRWPRICLPSLLPKECTIIVINLKDCFFIIPLQEKYRENFAFRVPTCNNTRLIKRYQWKVL